MPPTRRAGHSRRRVREVRGRPRWRRLITAMTLCRFAAASSNLRDPVNRASVLAVQHRDEVVLEAGDVVDDVAARGERLAWFACPGGVAREGVVGVPDDRARAAEAAELLVGEPFAGDPVAVPELLHARVVEYVAVPGGAGVAGEHRQPDREHCQLRVRVSVEDVRADPTGP